MTVKDDPLLLPEMSTRSNQRFLITQSLMTFSRRFEKPFYIDFLFTL